MSEATEQLCDFFAGAKAPSRTPAGSRGGMCRATTWAADGGLRRGSTTAGARSGGDGKPPRVDGPAYGSA